MRMHRKILKHLIYHGLDPNIEYVQKDDGSLVPRIFDEKNNFEKSKETFDEESKFTIPDTAKTVVESLDQVSVDNLSIEQKKLTETEKTVTTKKKNPPPRKKKETSTTD